MLSKLPDSKLIDLYLSGDNNAFKELLYRHKDSLYGYIYYLLKDSDLADDFFQDTFIKAITLIKQSVYSEKGYFYTWLCKIAHNMIIDYFRKNKINNISQTYYAEQPSSELFKHFIVENTIQDNIIEKDQLEELNYLISLLPQGQKEIINLRFYQNMSFKEIAETLNISINTALGRIRYAILNLRKLAQQKAMLY